MPAPSEIVTQFPILQDGEPPPKRKSNAVYPFGQMSVGESFIVPPGTLKRAEKAAWRYRERHMPWCFAFGKDSNGIYRIWRVEDKPLRIKGR